MSEPRAPGAEPSQAPDAEPSAPPPEKSRAAMVAWYDPAQLARTGLDVLISTVFSRNADRRVLDSVTTSADPVVCDLSDQADVWLDYVSDTGDGWDSTYAVAYHVAQPELRVEAPDGQPYPEPLRRGHALVFGGDGVYPGASRTAYERRLVAPYRTALPKAADPAPAVFAVPGNHDWYDSLVAFTRLFCHRRRFGGWRTHQRRSYFVAKLPHGWWLVGTDVQLESDIDAPQLEYFRGVAAEMGETDRVILCTAEPHWIYEAKYRRFDAAISERNLEHLESRVFGGRIAVYLAGDLHHYRRHAAPDGRQKITAGGGGAFLHPTHGDEEEVATVSDEFGHEASYPAPAESRRLAWRNLLFPVRNPTFGLATGALYVLLAWAVKADLGACADASVGCALAATLYGALESQLAVLWGLLLLFGFYFFTDTHSPRYKLVAGPLHGLAHVGAAFLIAWGAITVVGEPAAAAAPQGAMTARDFMRDAERLLLIGGLIFAGGYLAGSLIMGAYLLVSVNVFGRHGNEAFSSLRCKDYKSWLRFHLTSTGELHIYPIALRRVARRWRPARPSPGPAHARWIDRSMLEPDDARATPPRLIEPPVVVPGPAEEG